MTDSSSSLSGDLRRLYKHLSPRRRAQLGLLVVLMLIGAVAEMATLGAVVPFLALLADPGLGARYPFLQAIVTALGLPTENWLLAAAGFFSVLAMGAGALRLLLTYCSLRVGFGLGADIGGEIYRRTLHQPYSWHVSKNSSEILGGIEKVNVVTHGIIVQILQGSVGLVISVGILAMLFWIDAQTALIAGAGFALLYSAAMVLLRRRLVRNSRVVAHNVTQRVKAIQEGLGGIRDVLLDGTQPIYHRRFTVFDYALRRAQASNQFIAAAPRFIIESTGMVLIVGLAYWLAGRGGGLTGAIPVLGALAIGGQKLLPQMQLLYASWSTTSGNRHQLADVINLLDKRALEDEPQSKSAAVEAAEVVLPEAHAPFIALREVGFRYCADGPQVLRGIHMEIARGDRIGFIGKTGSGKSTLIDLIMGLLEPTEGIIEIDGEALCVRNRRAWQSRIAHVPQTIYLSDTTLAENIAFGVPPEKIDFECVRTSARQAQLDDFIESLTHQYQTIVGERGVRLSGGQRQRIGLARALYKQADVVVLDEATSALDDATEQSAIASINGLGNQVTVLMIAHRVTTLNKCNLLIELSNGAISRSGTYESIFSDQVLDSRTKPSDKRDLVSV